MALIVPTPINVITALNERIQYQLRLGETPSIILPDLRKRAAMIVAGKGLLPITTAAVDISSGDVR